MTCKTFVVQPDAEVKRIDIWLAQHTGLSRAQISQLIIKNHVLLNNKPVLKSTKVKPNDIITLLTEDSQNTSTQLSLIPQDLGLNVLYIDADVAVIDKPAAMVVYPSPGHLTNTLMNGVAYLSNQLASIGLPLRPGVVHRLDKDTSGVIVVALNDKTYYHLCEQFKNRTIYRQYLTLVFGDIRQHIGSISMSIGRSPSNRKKMSTVTKHGKEAITHWEVVQRFHYATLLKVKLGTGRTHQIRVHLSTLGHPVLGDSTYGKKTSLIIKGKKILFPRQMLHAAVLGFVHPTTGQSLKFESSPPEDMQECIKQLNAWV